MSGQYATLEDRFWAKVDMSGECWLWKAAVDNCGYGWFKLCGNMQRAHRVSMMLSGTVVPDGLCVLHKCDNPPCVNPAHLFIGTRRDNAKDRNAKHRQSCGAAHSLACSGENHGSSVLENNDVREIRSLCGSGVAHWKIADKFGVHKSLISKVNLRSAWAHVE